jgi:hypothetical protein
MRLASLSALVLLATLTASCTTTGSAGTSAALVACQSFKPVYWSKADTSATVAQIKEHNAAGKALCGWGGAK